MRRPKIHDPNDIPAFGAAIEQRVPSSELPGHPNGPARDKDGRELWVGERERAASPALTGEQISLVRASALRENTPPNDLDPSVLEDNPVSRRAPLLRVPVSTLPGGCAHWQTDYRGRAQENGDVTLPHGECDALPTQPGLRPGSVPAGSASATRTPSSTSRVLMTFTTCQP